MAEKFLNKEGLTQVWSKINDRDINLNTKIDNLTNKNKELEEKLFSTNDRLYSITDYNSDEILGLQVDYTNNKFTRLAAAANLSAGSDFDKFEMYGGRKRCTVQDDGTITSYYGDENYVEDGSIGQVMVYQPKFYYRMVPITIEKNTVTNIGYHVRKANYYVSSKPQLGFKLHPAFYNEDGQEIDYILIGAYEGSMYDVSENRYVNDGTDTSAVMNTSEDLLCSIANQKPISGLRENLTKANLELLAKNHGSNWHLETIKITSANQLLMIIELGIMDTQTAISRGFVDITDNSSYNCSSLTGSTSELGNSTGAAAETINEINGVETTYNTKGKVSITYRGIENPWGNIWKHINGINFWGDGTKAGGEVFIANNFEFNESKKDDNYERAGFTLSNSNGYIKAMGYGTEEFDWLFIPSEIGGTDKLPIGDYNWVTTNLNGYRIVQLGGGWNDGSMAGGFCWNCDNGPGDRYRNLGGRLVSVPKM